MREPPPRVESSGDEPSQEVEVAPVVDEDADAGVAMTVGDAGVGDVEDAASDERTALFRLGRRSYEQHCALCHDDGPRLVGRRLSPARVRRQVRAGSGRMRPIPPERVTERELNAIGAFLRGAP